MTAPGCRNGGRKPEDGTIGEYSGGKKASSRQGVCVIACSLFFSRVPSGIVAKASGFGLLTSNFDLCTGVPSLYYRGRARRITGAGE